MPWSKEDRSFKTLINRRTTSSDKAYYEELGDNTLNVHVGEIWAQNIDSSPAQAVLDGIAEQRTLFTLTEDTSVPSQQGYYADVTGTRLKDWISEKFGSSYSIHLYQNNGTEIFPTDMSSWFFDYQTGILTFNGNTASFAKPFKISGYRYIGVKGSNSGQSVYDILTVTSNDQTSFTLSYTPIDPLTVRMVPEGGIEYFNSMDYSVSTNIVTYLTLDPSFIIGDKVLFTYNKL